MVLLPLSIVALFYLSPANFAQLMLIICLLAAWEWSALAGCLLIWQRIAWILVVAALLLQILWHLPLVAVKGGGCFVRVILWGGVLWWLAALFLILSYPGSAKFWSLSRIWRLVFGLLTLIPFFSGMLALQLHDYYLRPDRGGRALLHILLVVWSADIGAYMFGKLLGRHRLIPNISPQKTWEGLIGGISLVILVVVVSLYMSPFELSPIRLVGLSVAAALLSVVGDLTESMFKRSAGLKDSGNIIPGHGGILDRIDGLMAAVPFFACLLL